MDLVDIIVEKRFLGREFLSWLWFKSEERGGAVALPDRGDVLINFEKYMLLESGEGENQEKLICRGLQAELQEARTGLLIGKQLEQARIRLTTRGKYEFLFTLGATLLDFRNVKLPKTMADGDEEDDPTAMEGRTLERIGMIEEVTGTVHELFRLFLSLRLGSAWEGELGRIRKWVRQAETN